MSTTPAATRSEPTEEPKTSTVVEPPDGGPPPDAGLPWIIYALSGVGAVLAIISFIIDVAAKDGRLSGLWLVVAMVAPLVTLAVIVGFQAHMFRVGLTSVAHAFREDMRNYVKEVGDLEGQLKDERSYTTLVNTVARSAHNTSRRIVEHEGRISETALATMSRDACGDIAKAFTNYIGEQARLCVKQVVEGGPPGRSPGVKAICRSNGLTQDDVTRWHPVADNSDFDELFTKRAEYWFCSDVTKLAGYKNSSVGDRPYKSVVVWPILARTGQSEVESLSAGYDVAAFLCLDAASADAFDEENVVALGWPVAEAIGKAFEAHYFSFNGSDTMSTRNEVNDAGKGQGPQ